MRLRDKVAIVTGAGTGLGRSIATLFAREGASVVVNGRRPGPITAVGEAIERAGGRALPVPADVTVAADVCRLVEATLQAFDRLDVLVNNAGVLPTRTKVAECTEEQWRTTLDGNLTSVFLCCKYAMPALVKSRGNIVNIASTTGLRPARHRAAYGASKAAVVLLTRSMALDYARQGVRVNAVCPAFVETDLNREWVAALRGHGGYETLMRSHPLGLGEPDDVAYATMFLASDEAKWITGVALPVDGGATVAGA
ncbi:MAG: SDR family oxidoreductase [Candidatus Rokubacteria bacterium]|nr:SDR family oxidoreductase [Candidatus Rokubacteria bacterium]MBI2198772.1 SDR family oxidoreductase [Candidatus Rokubacteria bacterium]